jgi:RND family efflux transporter MFP subunit
MSQTTSATVTTRLKLPRTRSLVLTGLSLALAAAVTVYTTTHARAVESAHAAATPPAPKVTVAPVEEKLLAEYDEFLGRVEATETVELRARVSGYLEDVRFRAGQIVKQGDVLFTIDPRAYQAQFDLAQARADVAEREARRADALLAASAISSEEAEARRARSAEARAALALARLDLEHTEVRAPIGGRVSRAFVTAGNLVSGAQNGATLLTTIVSTSDAFVYADIDEATMLKFNRLVRSGQLVSDHGRVPVEMQLTDESGFPRRGYIESTDNRLNSATGTLVVRMFFSDPDHTLVPGLFARVRIPVGAPQPTLLISERAIGTDQSQKFVLAVAPDRTAVYRTVKLGGSVEGKRVVRSGLRSGDQIIVNGLQRVRPGMAVDPEPAAVAVASLIPAPAAARTAAAN